MIILLKNTSRQTAYQSGWKSILSNNLKLFLSGSDDDDRQGSAPHFCDLPILLGGRAPHFCDLPDFAFFLLNHRACSCYPQWPTHRACSCYPPGQNECPFSFGTIALPGTD